MTLNSLSEFWRIIRAYWFIGNHEAQHFVRQVILAVLIGGGGMMLISLFGIPALTATVALAFIIGVPARMLWRFKYPLIVPVGAVALPKIDEDTWKLVKEIVWRATQALTLFGAVALYFSSPLSPFLKLSALDRLAWAPVFMLAFVVAGLCYLVGWRTQSGLILALTAASSLLIRVGGLEGATAKLEKLASQTTSPITLGFGNGYIDIPVGTREIVVVVPAGGQWTKGVLRPSDATCFWVKPYDTLEIAKYYGDGQCKWLPNFQPHMNIPDAAGEMMTSVRFRNSSHSEAVRVRIQFKG